MNARGILPLVAGAATLAVALGTTGCQDDASRATTGDAQIIGGSAEHNAEIPATIGISVAGHHACTAARVGPRQLITAAHCVLNLGNMTPYYDATHAVDVVDGKGLVATYAVREAHVHPLWTEACGKTLCSVAAVTAKLDAPDVAVLELAAELPVTLATAAVDRTTVATGDVVTVTGFGCTVGVHVASGNVAVGLRSGKESVVDRSAALHDGSYVTAADEPVYGGNYVLTAGQASLCPGDSGGPLYRAGRVVGVNANYTLLPDATDPDGVPVTNWHTRLDTQSRNQVAAWLSEVGVP